MNKFIKLESPCKVNLHLEVGNLREDGYHSLSSIFHLVSFVDRMTIEILEGVAPTVCVEMSGLDNVLLEDNLVYKAVKLFFKLYGNDFPVKIKLIKNIPAGAGLGGGSSNAASVLAGLNYLTGLTISNTVLLKQSACLGSDVPFFLSNGAAYVTGRGEFIKKIPSLTGMHIVLVVPNIHVSTKEAFNLLDKRNATVSVFNESCLDDYLTGQLDKWEFTNSFQPVIKSEYKEVKEAITLLKKSNADFVSLSGSGSAVFGLYLSRKNAINAEKMAKKHFLMVFRHKMIERFQIWM